MKEEVAVEATRPEQWSLFKQTLNIGKQRISSNEAASTFISDLKNQTTPAAQEESAG
jgi:hypothetical protein